MSGKSTIALVALLVALIAGYFLIGVTERVMERRQSEVQRIFSFMPSDLNHLTIEQDGARPVTGQRAEMGWTITAPEGIPANPVVWDRVAASIAELRNVRTVEESPQALQEFELSPPHLTVTFELASGGQEQVIAGAQDPFKQHRYARVGDGPVFLITENAFFELDRSLAWLRDRDLVKAGEEGIRRIEFLRYAPQDSEHARQGDPSVMVGAERVDAGGWQLTSPIEGAGDRKMLEELVNEVRFAKGRGYVDQPESLDVYGLDPPQARLTVYPVDGVAQSILFGNFVQPDLDEGGVYVKLDHQNSVFVIDAHIITLFPKQPEAFLEKRVLARRGSQVKSIEFAWGDIDMRLERGTGRRWTIVHPIEDRADEIVISTVVSSLLNMVGEGYYPGALTGFGLDDPAMRIRLHFEEDDAPVEIRVGALGNDRRYYITQETGGVTTVSQEEVDGLQLSLADFREKRLFDFPVVDAASVDLNFRGVEYKFELRGGRWAVHEPAEKVWETQADMELLLKTLAEARYEEVDQDTLPDNLASLGIDAPLLDFRVTLAGADGTVREAGPFRIGRTTDDNSQQRYAVLEGRPELLRVPQAIIDEVQEALRGVVDK